MEINRAKKYQVFGPLVYYVDETGRQRHKAALYCYADENPDPKKPNYYVLEGTGHTSFHRNLKGLADQIRKLKAQELTVKRKSSGVAGLGLYFLLHDVSPDRLRRTPEAVQENERRNIREGTPFPRSIFGLEGEPRIPRKLNPQERAKLSLLVSKSKLRPTT